MITLIAAIGKNNELAVGDKMLWNLPDDYNRFKQITLHHPVIMGRKSVETMPDVLQERTAFAISRNLNYKRENVITVQNIEEAIEEAKKIDEVIFIIGGGQIYNLGIGFGDRMELTRVNASFPNANVFFPEFTTEDWELVSSESHGIDNRHAYEFCYETWIRK